MELGLTQEKEGESEGNGGVALDGYDINLLSKKVDEWKENPDPMQNVESFMITKTTTAYETMQTSRRRKTFGSSNEQMPQKDHSLSIINDLLNIKGSMDETSNNNTVSNPDFHKRSADEKENDIDNASVENVESLCGEDDDITSDESSKLDQKQIHEMDSFNENRDSVVQRYDVPMSANTSNDETQEVASNESKKDNNTILEPCDIGTERILEEENHGDAVETDNQDTKALSESIQSANRPLLTTEVEEESKLNQPVVMDAVDLEEEDVLESTNNLFLLVTDKLTVTVKDIIQSICAEFNVKKLSKPLRNAVRQRLVELIEQDQARQEEQEQETDPENETNEDSSSNSDNEGDNEDLDNSVASVANDSDEEFDMKVQQKAKSKKAKKTKHVGEKSGERDPRSSQPKKVSMKLQKSAMRIHHEQLRKRRLEELKVRNEELQAVANKQDQERAELIAAKFDTNKEEMRLQRLENRLDLLQKLDQKRFECVAKAPCPTTAISTADRKLVTPLILLSKNIEETSSSEVPDVTVSPSGETDSDDGDSDDEDSDSDGELEIIGVSADRISPTKQCHRQSNFVTCPLTLLDLADQAKLKATVRPKFSSPGQSLNARAQLRQQLLSKQRLMGNNWLARELGYKSHEDHLRDCRQAEERKREMIQKVEEERIKANERRLLRERMLKLEGEINYDLLNEGLIDKDDNKGNKARTTLTENDSDREDEFEEEEDEELALAKALELEKAGELEEENEEDDNSLDVKEDVPSNYSRDEKDEEELHDDFDNASNESTFKINIEQDVVHRLVSLDSIYSDRINTEDHAQESNDQEASDDISPVDNDESEMPQLETQRLEFVQTESCLELQLPILHMPVEENELTLNDQTKSIDTTGREISDDVSLADTVDSDNRTSSENLSEDDNDNNGKPDGPRNSAWRAMLAKEAEQLKRRKKSNLVEEEADEEEEEQVAGLEDFGFTVAKKKKDDDEDADLDVDEDDLKDVVDDLSDDEGDEEAGEAARKEQEKLEEKERHKDMLRRMRDGYDGRRGGIAVGTGARGVHRFDQLVAADNKEDAKRLGLLNDDELDTDDEGKDDKTDDDEEEDEAALIDKMLKDRFLHRNSDDIEAENFSEDENDDENRDGNKGDTLNVVDEEEMEQERLAKRFAKRARMQRLFEAHEHEEEFSQLRLIDEDTSFKTELQMMKNGLIRKRSQSSQLGTNSMSAPAIAPAATSATSAGNKQKSTNQTLAFGIFNKGGSLAVALQNNRLGNKTRTSFVRNSSVSSSSTSDVMSSSSQKSIAFSHVVFQKLNENTNSQISSSTRSNLPPNGNSHSNLPGNHSNSSSDTKRFHDNKTTKQSSSSRSFSVFSQTITSGFQKRKR